MANIELLYFETVPNSASGGFPPIIPDTVWQQLAVVLVTPSAGETLSISSLYSGIHWGDEAQSSLASPFTAFSSKGNIYLYAYHIYSDQSRQDYDAKVLVYDSSDSTVFSQTIVVKPPNPQPFGL
jgi:hypothetical protein